MLTETPSRPRHRRRTLGLAFAAVAALAGLLSAAFIAGPASAVKAAPAGTTGQVRAAAPPRSPTPAFWSAAAS
ncbi:hypothetical protein QMK19_35410 [Streptomyces sp. H10-C2]|uniref:hypothetical protein n=1 Tax=unclassified Streptomyces TaxID=2593676 RepID=UPI0024B9F7F0|nr:MULTISPECIES: hypothetical protein [unclassified Streptomyces]MDJ0345924.1 hypothetical protein [Streptomyces sp. PH10-H1]MDJ0374773.1 hypothetical protein [Streptomyces sp. H10-C2]